MLISVHTILIPNEWSLCIFMAHESKKHHAVDIRGKNSVFMLHLFSFVVLM